MSSKLLSDFDMYYQTPEIRPRSLTASSIVDTTGSVFDDLACLDSDAARRSWAQEEGNLDILRQSNVDRVEHGDPSPPQDGATTLRTRLHSREAKSRTNAEVLFDAVEEMGKADDEEEFGDFESGVILPQRKVAALALTSAVSEDSQEPKIEGFQRSKQDSATLSYGEDQDLLGLEKRGPPEEASSNPSKLRAEEAEVRSTATANSAWPSYLSHQTQLDSRKPWIENRSDEGWGDFEDAAENDSEKRDILRPSMDEATDSLNSSRVVSSNPISTPAPPSTDGRQTTSSFTHNPTQTSPTSEPNYLPATLGQSSHSSAQLTPPPETLAAPSNIPPPSVLLALVTNTLHHHYNTLSSPQVRAASHRPGSDSRYSILQLAITAAHIIAGRKLRWKRDTLLAQNMRLGPSHAGKVGGMKLTGIDRAETLREDREVVDLVRMWKDHLGRVRSVLGATTSMPTSIPTLTETMPVKTAKGALTATKVCALCGLKREERVGKVDELVEDSFGEWWVEHWGHTTCKSFWDRYHEGLQHR